MAQKRRAPVAKKAAKRITQPAAPPPSTSLASKLQSALDREKANALQQRSLIGQLEMRLGKLAFDFVMTDPVLFAGFQKILDKKQLTLLKAYLGITPARISSISRQKHSARKP